MAKCTVALQGSTYGTTASNGTAVVFIPHLNPDGTSVKDTRK